LPSRSGPVDLRLPRSGARCFAELEKDFPGLKTIVLEKNYRSGGQILRAANRVIQTIPAGKGKRRRAQNGRQGKAGRLRHPVLRSGLDRQGNRQNDGGTDMLEAGEDFLNEMRARPFSDVHVLCRTPPAGF
jgi:superfamily I DNA/RNA helicase